MRKLRILVSFAFVMIGVLTLSAQMLNPLTWNVRLESNGGSDAELVVEAKIERGWHLYDIKLPKDGPVPTSIVWDKDRLRNVEIVGDLTPNRKAEENVDMFFHLILGTWENSVTFHQKVRLSTLMIIILRARLLGRSATMKRANVRNRNSNSLKSRHPSLCRTLCL